MIPLWSPLIETTRKTSNHCLLEKLDISKQAVHHFVHLSKLGSLPVECSCWSPVMKLNREETKNAKKAVGCEEKPFAAFASSR